ncbi:Oxidoreductase [Escherichia coli]|nr:Oxidoreductase [Escherichia coli]
MSDNIRVGVIGYGYASKTFHAPLIAGTPGLELAVISSSDETKVKADWYQRLRLSLSRSICLTIPT